MCDISLLKSRFDCLNGSQILEPLIKKKEKKKGSIHGRASLLHL